MSTHRQPDSKRTKIQARILAHPSATTGEIAGALGVTAALVRESRREIDLERRPRVKLPTYMAPGAGYRDHECAEYVDCLAGAAFAGLDKVHCPDPCERYRERSRAADLAMAVEVPRESWGGATW